MESFTTAATPSLALSFTVNASVPFWALVGTGAWLCCGVLGDEAIPPAGIAGTISATKTGRSFQALKTSTFAIWGFTAIKTIPRDGGGRTVSKSVLVSRRRENMTGKQCRGLLALLACFQLEPQQN